MRKVWTENGSHASSNGFHKLLQRQQQQKQNLPVLLPIEMDTAAAASQQHVTFDQ